MSVALPAGAGPAQANQARPGPFVGPRPFEAADRHLFFGREREAYEVSSLVLANRLFILYAMSGAGKTSLVNAGVLPLVQDDLDVLPTVRFLLRDPGADDAANVYTHAVLSCWTELEDLRRLRRSTLREFLAARPRVTQPFGGLKPQLLVFDQFEELFTAHPERWQDRAVFLEQLAEAGDSDPGLRVLIVLREDFLSRMLAFADTFYSGLKDRYFLEPLRKPAAELAITGPVRNTGRFFDPDAVDDLARKLATSRVDLGDSRIVQVEGEFVEPVLLQVVCQKLWAELRAGVSAITAADIRDVDTSLADFYSDAVRHAAELGQVPERQIREWVGQSLLTHPGGTRGTVHVGPQTTAGLPNQAVELLVGTLLRAEFRAGARWLEITHDSLLGPIEQSNAAFFRAEGPLSREADALAVAVARRLQSVVTARRLNDPAPLEVSWIAAEPAFTDSWEEVARPQAGTAWTPPAGVWVTNSGDLAGKSALAALIDRLPGRRLVVIGEPGSGKTMLLVRLVLDLLARRATGGPVPVLVSASTWDPVAQSLHSWLADQLAAGLPPLVVAGQPDGGAIAAGPALIAAGLILPVLDDLDEMASDVRKLAISRINDALRAGDFLVAASRTQQYQQTAQSPEGTRAVVRSAAVIQLKPPAPDEVDRYLRACAGSGQALANWEPVLAALGAETPARQALGTPLMVGLARARYNRHSSGEAPDSTSPAQLRDPRLDDHGSVEELLFGSFIASSSANAGGRWPVRRTEQWLGFVACYLERLTGDCRLAWWQLAQATPRYVLGLATGLVIGLLAAAVAGETLATPRLVAGELAAGVVLGLVLGSGLAADRRAPTGIGTANLTSASPRATLGQARRAALIAAAACGLVAGPAAGLAAGFGFGVPRGTIIGLLAAIMAGLAGGASSSSWLQWQLARAWLAINGRLPWRSISFLAEAHSQGALRQEGPFYQFRYANLKRRLAERSADAGQDHPGQPGQVSGKRSWARVGVPVTATLTILILATGSIAVSAHVASEHVVGKRAVPGTPIATFYSSTPSATFTSSDSAGAQVVAFSPNGRYLAVGDADGTVSLWDLTTHKLTATLSYPPATEISSIAFKPDGKTLAIGDIKGDINLWNLVTHRLTASFPCATKAAVKAAGGIAITDIAFSPAGQLFAGSAVSRATFACSPNIASHVPVFALPGNHRKPATITTIKFGPGAKALAVGSTNGETFILVPSKNGLFHLVSALSTPGAVESIAFSPDDRILALAASNGIIRLFNPRSLQPIGTPLADPGRSGGISSIAFSPDGRLLAAADKNGSTYVREVKNGKLVSVLSDPASDGVSGVAFSASSTRLATADLSGATYLWSSARSRPRAPQAGTTASASPAAVEATAINNLLVSSAQARSQWNASILVTDVADCVAIGSAITQIGNIRDERAKEVPRARHLTINAIPNGAIMKSQLLAALQISLHIDNDYLAWAKQQQSSGCTVGTNSAYFQDANSADSQATGDKETFLNTWDPIASQYGLQQFSADQI